MTFAATFDNLRQIEIIEFLQKRVRTILEREEQHMKDSTFSPSYSFDNSFRFFLTWLVRICFLFSPIFSGLFDLI